MERGTTASAVYWTVNREDAPSSSTAQHDSFMAITLDFAQCDDGIA